MAPRRRGGNYQPKAGHELWRRRKLVGKASAQTPDRRSEAPSHYVRLGPQEDCCGATGEVGQGEGKKKEVCLAHALLPRTRPSKDSTASEHLPGLSPEVEFRGLTAD